MENLDDEYKNYWETTMFFHSEELEMDSWRLEEAFSGSGESSSPDGVVSTSPASRNVISERSRRHKLNQRLYTLRSTVPNITKLDKASVIRDSIKYIEELVEEEKRLEDEIREMEMAMDASSRHPSKGFPVVVMRSKRTEHISGCGVGSTSTSLSPIHVLHMKVTCMGEKTAVVSVTCNKNRDTMIGLCQVFESLHLNILTANFSSFSDRLSHTLFLRVEEEDEKATLETKIQTAIAAFNVPYSPMCF